MLLVVAMLTELLSNYLLFSQKVFFSVVK